MNTLLIAYMKWVTEMMTIPVQVSQTLMATKRKPKTAEVISITAKADRLKER